jgi:hypothetical protein
MKRKIENIILKIYLLMPVAVKRNQKLMKMIGNIAERQLAQVKYEYLRAIWKKVQLEQQLNKIR